MAPTIAPRTMSTQELLRVAREDAEDARRKEELAIVSCEASMAEGRAAMQVGRPIPPYYYTHYYKNACSECMPVISIVIPI